MSNRKLQKPDKACILIADVIKKNDDVATCTFTPYFTVGLPIFTSISFPLLYKYKIKENLDSNY